MPRDRGFSAKAVLYLSVTAKSLVFCFGQRPIDGLPDHKRSIPKRASK